MRSDERKFWLDSMLLIAKPVLQNLYDRRLKEKLPLALHESRGIYAPLEAFGRTACGIAPWLELEGLSGDEAVLQEKYRDLMLEGIDAATDPKSPDYMVFEHRGERQALVDAAFLSQGLLRAPKQIAGKLDERVRKNLTASLRKTRSILPYRSNWLLFSALVEAALCLLGEAEFDKVRIDYAIMSIMKWYKGDGVYGDGEEFHWDYYNSFVIQPMLVDIIRYFKDNKEQHCYYKEYERFEPDILGRASRYASILERMIADNGTYPVVGRSMTYRFGVFHLLSQAALEHFLPEDITYAQVRTALSAVLNKHMAEGRILDDEGWLLPGVYGYQPELAEDYISRGSLYLCMTVFLPLGLSPSEDFWSKPREEWTAKKIWSGKRAGRDHAYHEE